MFTSNLSIIPYSEELKHHFYEINKEWISSMFVMEDRDKDIIENPDEQIIMGGGEIWFVKHQDKGIVGTCALMKIKDDVFELTKMGVYSQARGLKAGEFLLSHIVKRVRESNISSCYLLTNRKCEAAIHLYEKLGFVHDSSIGDEFGARYTRCDVAMSLSILR